MRPRSRNFLTLLLTTLLLSCNPVSREKAVVVYPRQAGELEEFAARELQRYWYLRTGSLADLVRGDSAPGGYDFSFILGKNAKDLGEEGFSIKCQKTDQGIQHVITGGTGTGTLYGVYRLLEKTGIAFTIDGDVLPDERFDPAKLSVNETGNPRFARRGLQPFHDFNVGPDWWNLADYQSVLAQMAKLRMNFIGFHTYPSWNPAAGPEANVWIGLPEEVDAQGNVTAGYEAGVVTTRRGWAVTPFPTSDYAAGAGLLFEADDYGPDYLLDCLGWPRTEPEAVAMFNRYGDMQQKVFGNAKSLGISTASGTELPLGIPEMVKSRLKAKNLNPEDPAVIKELYKGIFTRLMRKTPVDQVWFWMPEIWLWSKPGCAGWEITTAENVKRDIGLIQQAAKETGITSGFATSGWRLGMVENSRWTDENTPREWAMSSINTNVGNDPVEKLYGEKSDRPKWVIGWAEDDGTWGAHCCTCWDVQLWAGRMLANSADAFRYGVDGMMAIHWRTSSITPNISALSQAGWRFGEPGSEAAADPGVGTDTSRFWEEWGRAMFGNEAGPRAGHILQKFDGCHPTLNRLVDGGWRTTDKAIADLFAPIKELEALGKEVRGTGNRERLDYWINYLDASRLRVETWVQASRLDSIMAKASAIEGVDERRSFTKENALPARISLARSWEAMIGAYLRCARSTGEMGTITSIESGNRKRILQGKDSLMSQFLGTPLPAEAAVSSAYTGAPRIFITSASTRWKAGEPFEIRPFVLSAEKCEGVTLFWRPLGQGGFTRVEATHRARQAYRVTLPEGASGCVEYYLEARLANGKTIRHPATAPALSSSVVYW